MASRHFSYFLIVIFIKQTKTMNVHFNLPEIIEKDFSMTSHLIYESVKEYCGNRDNACRSNNTNICAVRMVNQKKFYKDFVNGCYLLLSNMCDHPEEEYFTVISGTCEEYLASRRTDETGPNAVTDDESRNNSTEINVDETMNETKIQALRAGFSTLYDIDTAYDYHLCPYSCPDTYSPVCVNVNRGFGKYFKLMTFVNHCSSDVYYCKHWKEFMPPDNEDESVRSSPLAWSFCGASRYLQFARFAEATSSMGHYGWLVGDYKYSHIMEPHQRIPGYG